MSYNNISWPQTQCQPVDLSNHLSIQANESFVLSLTPKKETKALDFIQQNPTADGRGVVIAILDTGVDPGAPGLSHTSDGKIKVIERYDCSGAGDVDTSTVIEAPPGEIIKGLTGREISIPKCLNNPSRKYHIGCKPVFDLYPRDLKERIQKERKEKYWDIQHGICIGIAEQNFQSSVAQAPEADLDVKFKCEDLAARYEILESLNKTHVDFGPVLDCILFQNEANIWQICLSIGSGETILLREYNYSHEYTPIICGDQFNISVNVWDDGNLLEIVGMCDDHGTHVAAIASAYFPMHPQLNGVAPGAQIISLTIGDNRMDTQETGVSMTRAMARVVNNPAIQVINMSYGGQSAWAPQGANAKMIRDAVDKYGVVWVSAAGNQGPGLSTICAPCWLVDDCIIGVAAYLSPTMMYTLYSHYKGKPGMPYTFSSRGPAPDGGLCVNICAPGGAITSIPNYKLMNAGLIHGTSMATPHCVGCVALLISRAIQENLFWTPYSIKRCLMNSAIALPNVDPFGQGSGLIQVPEAYEMLKYLGSKIDKHVRFNIECSGGLLGLAMRGIYIRNDHFDHPMNFKVSVTPVFLQNNTIDPHIKIMYKQHLTLVSQVRWIKVPVFFELHNDTRCFGVEVSPVDLHPGVHYTRIDAIDAGDLIKGPLFSVDVTVIIPLPVTFGPLGSNPMVDFGQQSYPPGTLQRFFIRPPMHATWAELNLKTVLPGQEQSTSALVPYQNAQCPSHKSCFVIHPVTVLPGQTYKLDNDESIELHLYEEKIHDLSVVGGKVVEIVIARCWQSIDAATLVSSVKFHGVTIDKPLISASAFDATAVVEISSHLNSEEISPAAELTHLVKLLRPTKMCIKTMRGAREEILPGVPTYELHLSYEFNISCKIEVMIQCPLLLDDGDYQSQLYIIFDHKKRYVMVGDAYSDDFKKKLCKGKYFMHLQIRHADVSMLHKLISPSEAPRSRQNQLKGSNNQIIPLFPVHLRMKLSEPIPLKVFPTLRSAILGDDDESEESVYPLVLQRHDHVNCYIRVLLEDEQIKKFPSSNGFCLEGKFDFSPSQCPNEYCKADLKIYLPGIPKDEDENKPKESESESESDVRSTSTEGTSNRSTSTEGTSNGSTSTVGTSNSKELPSERILKKCTDITTLTKVEDVDFIIDYLVSNEFHGLATKLLLHKHKKHPTTWNYDWNLKLRKCFEILGWTHCVFFLDTNWLVTNPPDLRPLPVSTAT